MPSWSKKLSLTDAQVPTKGYPVAYLRFTQSGNPHDVWVWVRNTLFGGAKWFSSHFGKNAVERADVKIDTTVGGKHLGTLDFFLTYDKGRAKNNKTPTVYLHYPNTLIAELKSHITPANPTGLAKRRATVTEVGGVYSLVIT